MAEGRDRGDVDQSVEQASSLVDHAACEQSCAGSEINIGPLLGEEISLHRGR